MHVDILLVTKLFLNPILFDDMFALILEKNLLFVKSVDVDFQMEVTGDGILKCILVKNDLSVLILHVK